MEKYINERSKQNSRKFEENVKTTLNTNVNPFELIYEGELIKQG